MTSRKIIKGLALAALAFLGPATIASQPAPQPKPQITLGPMIQAKPALWKLADKDTTIYLFGTIHILPGGVNWFHGPVAYAFNHSNELVTELPDITQADYIQALGKHGVLPPGQSLREKLSPEQRGRYEATMVSFGQPLETYDRTRPWVPSMFIPLWAIQKFGYDPKHGVEAALEARAKERKIPRTGLETIDFQFAMFSSQSEEKQIKNLDLVIQGIPEMKGLIADMVTKWSAGDPEALAALMQAENDDPEFIEAMLFSRNRTWAKWIDARMKKPGTVFMAVGSAHLAGAGSVNQLLAKGGYRLTRVQ